MSSEPVGSYVPSQPPQYFGNGGGGMPLAPQQVDQMRQQQYLMQTHGQPAHMPQMMMPSGPNIGMPSDMQPQQQPYFPPQQQQPSGMTDMANTLNDQLARQPYEVMSSDYVNPAMMKHMQQQQQGAKQDKGSIPDFAKDPIIIFIVSLAVLYFKDTLGGYIPQLLGKNGKDTAVGVAIISLIISGLFLTIKQVGTMVDTNKKTTQQVKSQ